MNEKLWFKPKAFTHFTPKLFSTDFVFVEQFSKNPKNILKHSFYPLIHKTIAVKRFKISQDRLGRHVKRHYTIKNGVRHSNVKYREVYYPTHLDSHIYAYYANQVLGPLYQIQLEKNPAVDAAVLAYRRIAVKGESRKKCNIDFANDLFELVKATKGEVAVLALDITKFFDSLNHKKLKQAWCALRGETSLRPEEYNIFKSLVDFKFVEIQDICKEFGFKHPNDIIKKKINCFVQSPREFVSRIVDKGYVKGNPFRSKQTDLYPSTSKQPIGIPQGTPISAFLANLYLLNFDREVVKLLEPINGTYRRYSDDLVIVCPTVEYRQVENKIYDLIRHHELIIQPEKTQETFFENGKLVKGQKPLAYLGFIFDGRRKFIRASSLSKFYRKMKSRIRTKAFQAFYFKNKTIEEKMVLADGIIHRTQLYKKYSYLGSKNTNPKKRNYISYADLATKIMKSPEVKRQLSKAWGTLHKGIEKWNKNLGLTNAPKK